jgi:cyclic pyranopterin phosphate synthase
MTAREIEQIVEVARSFHIRKVKITGGEPLLRKDIYDIISRTARHVDEVSLTTNGVLLEEKAPYLHSAGLKRVNVSLHSLVPKTYRQITGRNELKKTINGIMAALGSRLNPIKLNMVVLKGINDLEIPQTIDFAAEVGAVLQLIEFQPVQQNHQHDWKKYYYNLADIETWLNKHALKSTERSLHRRKKYFLKQNEGITCVEVVKPMHNSKFCKNCTRLRVTSTGQLKPCLLRNNNHVDTVPYLRKNPDLKGLRDAFKEVVSLREPYWKDDYEG